MAHAASVPRRLWFFGAPGLLLILIRVVAAGPIQAGSADSDSGTWKAGQPFARQPESCFVVMGCASHSRFGHTRALSAQQHGKWTVPGDLTFRFTCSDCWTPFGLQECHNIGRSVCPPTKRVKLIYEVSEKNSGTLFAALSDARFKGKSSEEKMDVRVFYKCQLRDPMDLKDPPSSLGTGRHCMGGREVRFDPRNLERYHNQSLIMIPKTHSGNLNFKLQSSQQVMPSLSQPAAVNMATGNVSIKWGSGVSCTCTFDQKNGSVAEIKGSQQMGPEVRRRDQSSFQRLDRMCKLWVEEGAAKSNDYFRSRTVTVRNADRPDESKSISLEANEGFLVIPLPAATIFRFKSDPDLRFDDKMDSKLYIVVIRVQIVHRFDSHTMCSWKFSKKRLLRPDSFIIFQHCDAGGLLSSVVRCVEAANEKYPFAQRVFISAPITGMLVALIYKMIYVPNTEYQARRFLQITKKYRFIIENSLKDTIAGDSFLKLQTTSSSQSVQQLKSGPAPSAETLPVSVALWGSYSQLNARLAVIEGNGEAKSQLCSDNLYVRFVLKDWKVESVTDGSSDSMLESLSGLSSSTNVMIEHQMLSTFAQAGSKGARISLDKVTQLRFTNQGSSTLTLHCGTRRVDRKSEVVIVGLRATPDFPGIPAESNAKIELRSTLLFPAA